MSLRVHKEFYINICENRWSRTQAASKRCHVRWLSKQRKKNTSRLDNIVYAHIFPFRMRRTVWRADNSVAGACRVQWIFCGACAGPNEKNDIFDLKCHVAVM